MEETPASFSHSQEELVLEDSLKDPVSTWEKMQQDAAVMRLSKEITNLREIKRKVTRDLTYQESLLPSLISAQAERMHELHQLRRMPDGFGDDVRARHDRLQKHAKIAARKIASKEARVLRLQMEQAHADFLLEDCSMKLRNLEKTAKKEQAAKRSLSAKAKPAVSGDEGKWAIRVKNSFEDKENESVEQQSPLHKETSLQQRGRITLRPGSADALNKKI